MGTWLKTLHKLFSVSITVTLIVIFIGVWQEGQDDGSEPGDDIETAHAIIKTQLLVHR